MPKIEQHTQQFRTKLIMVQLKGYLSHNKDNLTKTHLL